MADWTKPALTSTYTNFVTEVKDRDIDNAVWFEGSSSTSIPTNSKRLNTSTGRFETWNGTAWVDAVSTFTFPALSVAGALTVSGNASLATVTVSGDVTLNGGTANGVPYLNGSKVLTSGSALTFDGTTLNASTGSPVIRATASTINALYGFEFNGGALDAFVKAQPNNSELRIASGRSAGWGGFTSFYIDTSEQMRLTSTGLGIGTSSPGAKLDVSSGGTTVIRSYASAGNHAYVSVAGNAGVPGTSSFDLIQDGSSNVYLYNRANTYMAFGTNNTERMRLDSSGNLLVGKTAAAYSAAGRGLVEIYGTSTALLELRGGTATQFLYNDGTDLNFVMSNAGAQRFYTNGTERARIDSSGQMSTTNAAGAVVKAYDARAWVNFNGTGTVAIRSSGNVTSITDNGVGDYTVNYTTAMSNANYATNVTAVSTASGNTNVIAAGLYAPSTAGVGASSATTSSVRVSTRTSSGNQIDTDCVNVAVFI